MDINTVIFLVVAIGLAIYAILIYNGLISLQQLCKKSLSNIDVLLKQRNEELPKLVEICKRYMQHEQTTLTEVIQARSQATAALDSHNLAAMGQAENAIAAGLGKLFALAESYPDLKADKVYQELHQRVSELENSIADRRELYNEAVNNHNTRIKHFPDVIIASLMGAIEQPLLRFKRAELKNVDLKQLFDS